MKCKIIECAKCDDCTILEITRKQPVSSLKCSYFKSQKQLDRQDKKINKSKEDLESYKSQKKKK
jgi:hypothetical protein